MKRWTSDLLNKTDPLLFSMTILSERVDRLSNPNAPLARKLRETISYLDELRGELLTPRGAAGQCGNAPLDALTAHPAASVRAHVLVADDTICFEKPHGEDDSLLPCPFCHGKEIIYEKYRHAAGERWRVLCCDCLAVIDPGHAQQKYTVQTMWNRRDGQKNPQQNLTAE